jgi:hypothetical protein
MPATIAPAHASTSSEIVNGRARREVAGTHDVYPGSLLNR